MDYKKIEELKEKEYKSESMTIDEELELLECKVDNEIFDYGTYESWMQRNMLKIIELMKRIQEANKNER